MRIAIKLFQGMIALRRDAKEVIHEDYIDGKTAIICMLFPMHHWWLCRCDGSPSKEEEKLNLLCIKCIVIRSHAKFLSAIRCYLNFV